MNYLARTLHNQILEIIASKKSILLLGPRQTGKTTLLRRLNADLYITLIKPRERQRYEKNPDTLSDEVAYLSPQKKQRPLIIIDEIQKVPLLMDVIQDLIDNNIAQFILTGSSARKLKKNRSLNLMPGRLIKLVMDPITLAELNSEHRTIESLLLDGTLPEIITTESETDKERLLDSYVSLYLEEEVRAEAYVRNIGHFGRFLELAASESGYIINFSKLSQVIGISHTTVADYYQILEDCMIAEKIEPFLLTKTRHRLSKKPKYIFFDLGVRRLAAKEGKRLPHKQLGHLFEQFIGLELVRHTHGLAKRVSIKYWRDLNGPEVDFIIEHPNGLIPIEVKYTDNPQSTDAKNVQLFLNEYDQATHGYIICRIPRPRQISEHIIALPWRDVIEVFPEDL